MDVVWLLISVIVLLALTIRVLSACKRSVVSAQGCWCVDQRISGWLCIAAGLICLILPGPGLLLIGIGMARVGGHDSVLHRVAALIKLRLRTWARQDGLRGALAKRGLYILREQRRYIRRGRIWLGTLQCSARRDASIHKSCDQLHSRAVCASVAGCLSNRRRSSIR